MMIMMVDSGNDDDNDRLWYLWYDNGYDDDCGGDDGMKKDGRWDDDGRCL